MQVLAVNQEKNTTGEWQDGEGAAGVHELPPGMRGRVAAVQHDMPVLPRCTCCSSFRSPLPCDTNRR